MEQTGIKLKSWKLPFWFMAGISVLSFSENLFALPILLHYFNPISWPVLSAAMFWPLIVMAEAVIYWFIRKKIVTRRWVWAHLMFSLFAFVLLYVVYFVILYFAYSYIDENAYFGFLQKMLAIKFYVFLGCIVIGNVFFIAVIVRSFSVKNMLQYNDTNDLLSEVADFKH